jgi:hypothetical protein
MPFWISIAQRTASTRAFHQAAVMGRDRRIGEIAP